MIANDSNDSYDSLFQACIDSEFSSLSSIPMLSRASGHPNKHKRTEKHQESQDQKVPASGFVLKIGYPQFQWFSDIFPYFTGHKSQWPFSGPVQRLRLGWWAGQHRQVRATQWSWQVKITWLHGMRRRQNATEWEVSLMRHGHIGHGTFGTFCNEMQSGWPRLSSKIRWGSSEGCVLRWIEHRICCPDIPGTLVVSTLPKFLRFHDCLEHAYIFFRYTDTRSTLTPKTCFFFVFLFFMHLRS